MFKMKSAGFAALTLPLLLAACGGATAPLNVSAQSQTLSGPISSLSLDRSTLTVAGTTVALSGVGAASLSTSSLRATANGTAIKKNGKASSAHALSIGQNVTIQETGGVATEVDVNVELRGAVVSVGASSLMVAGQTVNVDAHTRFGLASDEDTAPTTAHTIADVAAGEFVEITGQRDASGTLLASNIEVKSPEEIQADGEDENSEVKGTLSALDASAHTFTVNGTAVSYDPATVRGTLADGVEVNVEGSFDASTSTLVARKVEVESKQDKRGGVQAGALVTLEARVTSLDAASKTFVVHGLTVDYAKATLTGQLAVNAEVKVRGTVDASSTSLLHATAVTVSANDD